MRAARVALVLGLAALGAGCPVLGRSEEGAFAGAPEDSADRVPVVDDVGPFDPSEAVDDDDGAVVVDATGDATDGAAFEERGAGRGGDAAENEREEGEPDPDSGLGKEGDAVAGPARVAAREGAQREAVARADEESGDEDARKAQASANPPPEPTRDPERPRARVLDYALEALLLTAAAALVSTAIVFAASHPRSVALGVAVAAALAWFLWSQRA